MIVFSHWELYGDELREVFRDLKAAFDPDWLLNPGQVCGPRDSDETDDASAVSLTENLRSARTTRSTPDSIHGSTGRTKTEFGEWLVSVMAGSFGYETEHLSMSRAIVQVCYDQVNESPTEPPMSETNDYRISATLEEMNPIEREWVVGSLPGVFSDYQYCQ